MKIYFVRHGQSVDAQNHFHQTFDTPLSDLGQKQAKFLGQRLKSIKFSLIYASPFPRAHETAEIINKTLKTKLEVMETVHEVKRASKLLGIKSGSEETQNVNKLAEENKMDPNWKYEDGESLSDVWDRAGQAMKHLLDKHSEETVLVVTHEHFIKIFLLRAMLDEKLDMHFYHALSKTFSSNNTGVTQINYSPEKGWKLALWNDVSHIESPEDMTG